MKWIKRISTALGEFWDECVSKGKEVQNGGVDEKKKVSTPIVPQKIPRMIQRNPPSKAQEDWAQQLAKPELSWTEDLATQDWTKERKISSKSLAENCNNKNARFFVGFDSDGVYVWDREVQVDSRKSLLWSKNESKFDSYEARFVKGYIKPVQELIEKQAAIKAYLEWISIHKDITKPPISCQSPTNPFNDRAEKQQETESKRKQELEVIFLDSERQIKDKFLEYNISSLWHLTHKSNIHSIIKNGILNHYDAYRMNVSPFDISDPGAQKWRDCEDPQYNRRIHDYAPLYITPLNPMLYVRKHLQVDLCVVEISLSVLVENQYLMTDGNAASHGTKFYSSVNNLEFLPWDVLCADYWHQFPDGKRKRCAEVLVYPKIPPKFIVKIHCYSNSTLDLLSDCGRDVSVTKNLFF